MANLKILDVTLRDGGCVNNFNFGLEYMNNILNALEVSNVDYIELGYLDSKNGSLDNRTQFKNEKCIYQNFLLEKKKNTKYVAMIDYGKFPIDQLEPCNSKSIDGIRLCFHKKDRFNIIETCKKIIELGYECFVQPMLTLRYSKEELIELIDLININIPNIKALYIVDSFGEMRETELKDIFYLFEKHLSNNIAIGFHSHNNLQLSYSNAIALINFPTIHNIMVDSSIMGMGKGAGNLNTELLLEHINLLGESKYKITPLLNIIDTVIKPLHNEYRWGYSVEYYLSSINHCTPSYASHFYNKHMLPINKINDLLSLIREEKKISFDKDYAEEIYRQYNESQSFDDHETLEYLYSLINNKDVIIIGPGKSINTHSNDIISLSKNKIIISLNFIPNFINPDLIFITRHDLFSKCQNDKTVVASNLSTSNKLVIEYKKWIEKDFENIYDSSAVFALKIACFCKAKSIYLAGLDGFTSNINENYFNKNLRRGLSEEQSNKRNDFYYRFIKKLENEVSIKFITPSLYNKEKKYD